MINLVSENNLHITTREVLAIICDHPESTFDFISRRFVTLSPQTVHYHIGKLIKLGLIRKLGQTRGVVYVANTDIL